jgi:hypothetical protein
LLAVAQDDYAQEMAPAVQLQWELLWRTLLAMAVAAALVTAFWVIVSNGLIDAPRSRLAAFLRRRSGLSVRSATSTRIGTGLSTVSTATNTPQGTDPGRRDVGQN